MAKKSKETKTTIEKKEVKVKAPADPVKTKNFVRLLNILALLLALIAFILQFSAVITHYWKRQSTNIHPLLSTNRGYVPSYYYDDSRIDQDYGLFSRDVKVYANSDEQLNILASTRFPRLDNGEQDLYQCLVSRSSTLRSALLTCSDRVASSEYCHCRRYPFWNAIIVFEIAALILLGLVVVISALLTTQYHGLLKPIGVLLSLLAFLFLLVGLILLLSYLKRETRTIADIYPHIYSRLTNQFDRRYGGASQRLIRRQAQQTYRAYSLLPGQYPHNATHFRQYLENTKSWIYISYASIYPVSSATQPPQTVSQQAYPSSIRYDQVYENTNARIGCSAILSILAMILALVVPLILALSWITAKKLQTDVKTVTTTIKTEYVPVPKDSHTEMVPLTQTTNTEHVQQIVHDITGGRPDPVIVRDVVIRGENPITVTTEAYRT